MSNVTSIYKNLFKKISKSPRVANHKIAFYEPLYNMAKKIGDIEDTSTKKACAIATLHELRSTIPIHLNDCPEDIRKDVADIFQKFINWLIGTITTDLLLTPPNYLPPGPSKPTDPQPLLG